MREQLTNKEHYASGLEVLLRERLARIDELTAKLEQARALNHQLEEKCEHLGQASANSTRQA